MDLETLRYMYIIFDSLCIIIVGSNVNILLYLYMHLIMFTTALNTLSYYIRHISIDS